MAAPSTCEGTVAVRDLAPGDEAAWRALWKGYCDFYGVSVPASVTDATWRRLIDPDAPLFGLVACDAAGRAVGIVNCVLHPVTWSAADTCYLEDLFVAPEARKRGAGRALIEAVRKRGEAQGWYRVYWMTKVDNRTARALYDKLTGGSEWVRYHIPLDAPA